MLAAFRAVLACIPAALAGAVLGVLCVLIGIGIGFPAMAMIGVMGFPFFILPAIALGFLPCLAVTGAVVLPAHVFFICRGLRHWAWYLAAGCLAGAVAAGLFYFGASPLAVRGALKVWFVEAALLGSPAIGPVFWFFIRSPAAPAEQIVIEPY